MAHQRIVNTMNQLLGTNSRNLKYRRTGDWYNKIPNNLFPIMLCSKEGYIILSSMKDVFKLNNYKSYNSSFRVGKISSERNYIEYPKKSIGLIWKTLSQINNAAPLP
jgi:hypothetical protein